ncbi:MAG: WD40 repeat domain-containing protein [Chthonomonadales bacterium]
MRHDLTLVATSILCALLGGVVNGKDGNLPGIASGSVDQSIRFWDSDGKESANFMAHDGAVNCLIYLSDGRVISGGDDNCVKVWSIDGLLDSTFQSPPEKTAHSKPVLCLALSPNGKVLASGGADRLVRFWNPATGKLLQSIPAHNGSVKSLAWSPDGQTLASGGADRLVQLWRANGSRGGTIIGHDEAVTALAWTQDNRALITGSADGNICAWNIPDYTSIARTHGHSKSVTAIALSPDGRTLATAGSDQKLRIWSFSGKAFTETASLTYDKPINCLAWGPRGQILIAGSSDKTLRYYGGTGYATLKTVKAHDGPITTLAVAPIKN